MWTQNLNQRHKFTCKIHWQLLASVVCAKVVFFFNFLEHFLVQNQHSCFWENFFAVLYFQSIFTSEYTVLSWMFCKANDVLIKLLVINFRLKFELQDSHLHLIVLDLLKTCNIHQEYQFCKICLWGVDAF